MAISKYIKLSSYGVLADPINQKRTLADQFTNTITGIAAAKSLVPDCFSAYKTMRGWTDSQIMGLSAMNAMYTDAVCKGALIQSVAGGIWRVISRNYIDCDLLGAWWINDYLCYAYGTYKFPSSGTGNAEYNGDLGGFELMHWSENWVGPVTNRTGERILFSAYHGGSDVLVDYSEGTWFEGALRINGRCGDYRTANTPVIVGAEWWDMGEGSQVPGLFAHHCDIGQRYARGTPGNAPGTQSTFSNNVCGTEFMGCANVHIAMLSGDDNPALFRSVAGYGRPATLNAHLSNIKSEWAVTPSNLRLWKPQEYQLNGQFKLKISLLTYAATNARTQAMFRLNPTLSDSYLRVDVMDVFDKKGPDYLAVDLVGKKAWKFDPWIVGFEYSNLNGGSLKSWPVQAVEVPYTQTQRSGYVAIGAQFSADGSPFWNDSTGNSGQAPPSGGGGGTTPPTPAEPVLKWASTFSGSNAGKLVATTGSDVSSSASWSGLAKAPNGTATTTINTIFPLVVSAVRRVVLKGFTLTAPVRDYTRITNFLKVRTDGTILQDGTYITVGKVTPGTKADVTINLTTPSDMTHVLGFGGECAIFSCESMEIYA